MNIEMMMIKKKKGKFLASPDANFLHLNFEVENPISYCIEVEEKPFPSPAKLHYFIIFYPFPLVFFVFLLFIFFFLFFSTVTHPRFAETLIGIFSKNYLRIYISLC